MNNKKTIIFEICKGTSKLGKTFYYIHNEDLDKSVYLTNLEVKVLKMLKLITED